MEKDLFETLTGYRDAALKLKDAYSTAVLGSDIPDEIRPALLRMGAAISLNEKLDRCEAFLSEETPEEVTEAFYAAQEEITRATDDAYREVEKYASYSEEFQQQVETLSASSESTGLTVDLLKLYKCEGIIRMAYDSMQKYPVIGTPGFATLRFEEQDNEATTDPEQYLHDQTGVDVYALLEVRSKLVANVQREMADGAPGEK